MKKEIKWTSLPGLARIVRGRGVPPHASEDVEKGVDRIDIQPLRRPAPEEIPPAPTMTPQRKPRGQAKPDVPQLEQKILPVVEAAAPLEIYNEFFGLTALPFALTPDPDFLFWSPAHKRAFAMLEYGVMTHSPITLITGEVGAGKTTLLQHLLRSIGPDVHIGLISNPHGSRSELLRWVLMALDQPAEPEETYVDLFSRFQKFVIDEYARGCRVVLIFDEAQNLDRDSLEELRMFTNINTGRDVLLQLVLVGQPELRDIVARKDMRQFAQRVAALFHLPSMDKETVRSYINHRLTVAGRTRKLFLPDAVDEVFVATGGVPRLVNRLCDLALVYAFTARRKQVDAATIREVVADGAFFPVVPDSPMDEK